MTETGSANRLAGWRRGARRNRDAGLLAAVTGAARTVGAAAHAHEIRHAVADAVGAVVPRVPVGVRVAIPLGADHPPVTVSLSRIPDAAERLALDAIGAHAGAVLTALGLRAELARRDTWMS